MYLGISMYPDADFNLSSVVHQVTTDTLDAISQGLPDMCWNLFE